MKIILPWLSILCLCAVTTVAQTSIIIGKVTSGGKPVALANIALKGTGWGASSDVSGAFTMKNIIPGMYRLRVSHIGYDDTEQEVLVQNSERLTVHITLHANQVLLNEVVVTGVSKATLARENPVAIVGISPGAIERTTASNLMDVLAKNVPGLHMVKTGPNVSKPSIRGLGYNRVLTLYDGIRQEGQQWGDEHSIEVDAYDINRAEVIKGPASLMYGSDALAGVINLFPYVPDNDDGKLHGKFISEYQQNNNLVGNGLRLGYQGKHFLFALRGSYRLAKNYRNAIDGRVYNTNFDEKNLSALLGFKTDKGYSHFNITLYSDLQGIPDGSRDSLTRKFTKQVYEGNNDDITNRPLAKEDELNTYRLPPLHQRIDHYRIYTHHFYQLGKGDVDLIFSLQQNNRREYNHPTMPCQPGMHVQLNTLNYGLRYNAPRFANIEATLGMNGMLQQNKSIDATDFPIPDYHLRDGGVYLYVKWKSNQWSMSGGLRYDQRLVRWNDFFVRTNLVTGFDEHVVVPDTANAVLQFQAYEKVFSGLSASWGLTFQATRQIGLKFNIGRGYRAPNITEMASNGLDPGAHIIYLGNRNFDPEFSLETDIGASARFNDFSADLSVFNNHIQNYIHLTMLADNNGNPLTDAQGNRSYQYQQASAQLYGMEAVLSIHPAKIKGFSFNNTLSVLYGFNKNTAYKGKGVQGEYLPLIPPLKIGSSMTQKIETTSKLLTSITPNIEIEFTAKQNQFLGVNNMETATPGYTLLHAGLIAEIRYAKKQTLQFQLQVNNLLDKVYQSHLSRLKYFEYYRQAPNGHQGIYNMGRNISLKMIMPF
jgi:iron complex outermembrane receptor protein